MKKKVYVYITNNIFTVVKLSTKQIIKMEKFAVTTDPDHHIYFKSLLWLICSSILILGTSFPLCAFCFHSLWLFIFFLLISVDLPASLYYELYIHNTRLAKSYQRTGRTCTVLYAESNDKACTVLGQRAANTILFRVHL